MKTANVIQAGRVSIPDNGQPAIRIITDLPDRSNAAFYMEVIDPAPAMLDPISWGTHQVWWKGQRYRKLGWSFDPAHSMSGLK